VLSQIEEHDETGPGAGLKLFAQECAQAACQHVQDQPDIEALKRSCSAFGAILSGVFLAGEITEKKLNDWRSRFVAQISDSVDVEHDEDAYDIAAAAFDEGAGSPRTDLADIAARQKRERSDEERSADPAKDKWVAGQVASVLEALQKTQSGDDGALFERGVIPPACDLREHQPAEFERVFAKIKAHSSDLAKRWLRQLDKQDTASRKKAREEADEQRLSLALAATKGGRTAEAVKEDEESGEALPAETAHEYGTGADFDPLNEYMRSTLFRLMNRDYSVVGIGGDVRILEVTLDGLVVLHRVDAFLKKFENVRVPVPDRKSPVNAAGAWMQWPRRSTHDGVGFYPGTIEHPPKVPTGHFNMWRGFCVEPKPGKWSLLHAHMLNVYCNGDNELLCWLLDWVAQMLQEPQRKPGTSVVFRSRTEGTGKSLFAHLMGKLIGSAVLSASRDDQVAGRFNSHLQNCLLLVAEEAVYAGSKRARGILKDLITCASMGYEAKGLPVIMAPNYTRVLFISNEAHVVDAGSTSRRFAVFDCENPRAGDKKYFKPLFAEMDNGGAEAFLDDMLRRTIKSDLRSPPVTQALIEQREASLDGFGKWLLTIAQSGQVFIPERDRGGTIDLDVREGAGAKVSFEELSASAKPYLDQYEQRTIDHKLGRLLKEVGAEKRRLNAHGRPWGYAFPPLPEFREAVAERLGVTVEPFVDAVEERRAARSGSKVVDLDAVRVGAKSLRKALA